MSDTSNSGATMRKIRNTVPQRVTRAAVVSITVLLAQLNDLNRMCKFDAVRLAYELRSAREREVLTFARYAHYEKYHSVRTSAEESAE
jgi:hypothetical protein